MAEIVDLNEHIPPDPVATDTNPGYTVPSLPNDTQKLTANWGVWSCYWVPVLGLVRPWGRRRALGR